MCGIAGIFSWQYLTRNPQPLLQAMVNQLRHRGPDQSGLYLDDDIGIGQSRLSIIDLYGGSQPISNEDGTVWLVCNGEIFNYVELRRRLRQLGHHFVTRCDVEVLLHLYEEFGAEMLKMLNGQFALAIWDQKHHQLFLARDHVGICPLYYIADNFFAFASEMKAFGELPGVRHKLDVTVLAQTCVFWSPLPGKTPFTGIKEVRPGCYMRVQEGYVQEVRYWAPEYRCAPNDQITDPDLAAETVHDMIEDAVRVRLRADVPVGAYLSGGLDSSITTGLIRRLHSGHLRTFSISFDNPQYDETPFQEMVSQYFKTDHTALQIHNNDLGENLREVIWHTEKPLLRSAPIPLFLLSRQVQRSGYKVVLTGEGSDEFFSGYNIYKETKLRCFAARQPQSTWRPILMLKLYPYLDARDKRNNSFWQQFFMRSFTQTEDPFYSHRLRWQNGAFILQFFAPEVLDELAGYDPVDELQHQLAGMMDGLDPLARCHFLEYYIFLGSYLLCSQGDRMLMSHSIEGRYPFLDKRVIQLANHLAPNLKLRALNEKWILKRAFRRELPQSVVKRPKMPYRAPIRDLYLASLDQLSTYFQPDKVHENGLFDPRKLQLLHNHFVNPQRTVSAREEMALMLITSVQMLQDLFGKPGLSLSPRQHNEWLIYDKRSDPGSYAEKGALHHVTT
ncbi:MAG TPA: asparagine synthase (glutamine-hydrolyzing) [bacterium]|nr:asparagine synthase (glutamine-hydrolyzing) [bacterium]HQI47415.1 asparagine synthase (glutamine-hydrolyzing) [bacterium]HQJ63829.1 asparagine synthase (glutamine-hydrolyzing) [bacterium]